MGLGRAPLGGRGRKKCLASLSPDFNLASRLAISCSWFHQPTWQLKSDGLTHGTCRFVITIEILPTHRSSVSLDAAATIVPHLFQAVCPGDVM